MNAFAGLPIRRAIFTLLFVVFAAAAAFAQNAGFTYQSRLTEGANNLPANGRYDFQFSLFNDATAGTQIDSTKTLTDVQVTNGVFTVVLDFGAAAFSGEKRWLQISVRLAGNGAFTPLSPRREISPTPYAIRSQIATAADRLSPTCAGCVTDAQIAAVTGSKVTGTIPAASVPTGSSNYIQNTTTAQADSDFNISGNGTAGGRLSGGIVSAAMQYDLNGTRVLSVQGTENLFAGRGTGTANTTGLRNSFVGHNAGLRNTVGESNSFFGFASGTNNVSGVDNSFFGSFAGNLNIASGNSFFGRGAGGGNTTGDANSSFGKSAGNSNVAGSQNSFFGFNAGFATMSSFNSFFGYSAGGLTNSGSLNTFIGHTAGGANTMGNNNTIIGSKADVGATNISFATAIGSQARVDCSNCLVLGGISGINGGNDTNVGIGTTTPSARLHVSSSGGISVPQMIVNQASNADAAYVSFRQAGTGTWTLAAFPDQLTFRSSLSQVDLIDFRRTGANTITVFNGARLTSGGTWTNSSDRNLKHQFSAIDAREILARVARLPIQSWSYKAEDTSVRHIGPMAQDFAAAFQLGNSDKHITTVDADGVALAAIQGLHQLVEEKSAQIEQLMQRQQKYEAVLEQQRAEIEALKKLVCLSHPDAELCKPGKGQDK